MQLACLFGVVLAPESHPLIQGPFYTTRTHAKLCIGSLVIFSSRTLGPIPQIKIIRRAPIIHNDRMRILIIGRLGEYNAEYFYTKYFRRLGHDVETIDMFQGVHYRLPESLIHSRTGIFRFTLNMHEINHSLYPYVRKADPDAIIVFRGEMLSKASLDLIRSNYHIYLFYPDVFKFLKSVADRISIYEAVFTAARVHDPYVKLGARKVVSIPWCCDPDFHISIHGMRKVYNVSFIGTAYPERRKILRKLRDVHIFGDYWYGFGRRSHGAVRGEDYVRTVNESLINLNLQTRASINGDAPTMRTFEIAGCGGFQISDFMPSMSEFFPRLPTFRSMQELKELLSYYSGSPPEVEETSYANQEKCYRKFTYEIMAKNILLNMHRTER